MKLYYLADKKRPNVIFKGSKRFCVYTTLAQAKTQLQRLNYIYKRTNLELLIFCIDSEPKEVKN